jgi:hypothetical protein
MVVNNSQKDYTKDSRITKTHVKAVINKIASMQHVIVNMHWDIKEENEQETKINIHNTPHISRES